MPAAFSGTDSRRRVVHAILPPPRPAAGDHRRCAGRLETWSVNGVGLWAQDRKRCTVKQRPSENNPDRPSDRLGAINIRLSLVAWHYCGAHMETKEDHIDSAPALLLPAAQDCVHQLERAVHIS